MMNVLSEITCIWPTPGSFIDHAGRFVDPAIAFATGESTSCTSTISNVNTNYEKVSLNGLAG